MIPTGTITQFAGSTPPAGWLFCDGSALSRLAFASLFAVIGEIYGHGDGSTTFNLPDFRTRGPVMPGPSLGVTAIALGEQKGNQQVSLNVNQLPEHQHSYNNINVDSTIGAAAGSDVQTTLVSTEFETGVIGSGLGVPTISPCLGVNFMVKL